jgi:antitoxin PrlF
MPRVTLRPKGQLTLPAEIREALHVAEGDEIEFDVAEDGVVVMHGLKTILADQAWFWTESWQAGERQATAEIESGQTHGPFKSAEEMFADLDGHT